ncbi:MAG: tRNA (adenosine(37)-N6)-dimethylallyltransferase MiaA [Clostridia bacterium]|nr:tRNA (adenosine(37)-N6)-dimethylallyltransferase MiaA [Clostridia bacterium]
MPLIIRSHETGKLPNVICIVGPTASGKTGLGVAASEMTGGEVISADSMQIYKYMDIGTAKPTATEMRGIRHHLIDFLDPHEDYSVVQYASDARKTITDISKRGKTPVLVGGTGQYVSALVDNISFDETESDPVLHAELEQFARDNGPHALHEMLREIDPEAAANIHENNLKRVLRAVEMRKLTGLTLSARNEKSRLRPVFARYRVFGISIDRAELYERIDRRVDAMLENGLIDEARRVLGMDPGRTASQAIGYKELVPYFSGEVSLEAAADQIRQNTRNYAKRQLTWFRRCKWVEWLTASEILGEISRV